MFYLLLFVGVFGSTLGAGLGAGAHVASRYVDYVTPAIILITVCSGAEMVAVAVNTDMTEGIISRFRTMAIAQGSVLTGQVLGSVIRTLISGVLVITVALAMGFHAHANPLAWLAAAGLFAFTAFALNWLTVAFGLFAKTPAGANSLALLVVLLPFLSSAFVPTASMPAGLRWFAENQPFTPIIDTLRGLLLGGASGSSAVIAVAWCAGIATVGYLWARRLYGRTDRG